MSKTHAPWRALFALLALWLVAPVASAQAAGDQGQYQIMHARYGTPDRHVDVTARLKELARQDTQFRLSNATFGVDPAYGETKTLRLFTRGPDGRQRIFDYREGSVVDGTLFTGWNGGDWGHGQAQGGGGWSDDYVGPTAGPGDAGDYRILSAVYGTAENYIDVTKKLRELARQDRTLRIGNDTFGADPAYGRAKTLRILARDKQGHNRTFEYAEGHAVDGTQFVGWDRGEWGEGSDGDARGDGNCRNLRILRATYGAGARQLDVTTRLQGLVHGDRLSLKVTNSQLGADPAPGDTKSLDVTWCAAGKTQQSSTSENGYLSVP